MANVTTKIDSLEPVTETAVELFDNWFDPIESGVRELREFIEDLFAVNWMWRWLAHATDGPRTRMAARQASLATGTAAASAR